MFSTKFRSSAALVAAIVGLLLGIEVNASAQEIDLKSLFTGGAKIDIENDADEMRRLQSLAMVKQKSPLGRWGHIKGKYSTWVNHSNRLIPVYTFGLTLDALREEKSAYTSKERLRTLYGVVPDGTLNPQADYYDQTDLYRLQIAAADAGYKNIIVLIFDGMDWQTTRAAAIYKQGAVEYTDGRGKGLAFQDYSETTTDFGLVCTSALLAGAQTDVDAQAVLSAEEKATGGYDVRLGGEFPWAERGDHDYLIGLDRERPHTVTDSAASATSLFSGIKTFNGSINFSADGKKKISIARRLQRDRKFRIGLVSSVPLSHATIGGAYANNITRKDYQDISRDLLGLPSSSHRKNPLPGVDVLIGGGWGSNVEQDKYQGQNYLSGNKYLHDEDIKRASKANGGKYIVAQRTPEESGRDVLQAAAGKAAQGDARLLGFFGAKGGHFPFRTADGNFNPTVDAKGTEIYSPADIHENPTLADATHAALTVLEKAEDGFWLLVEAGDVDWANHANNVDNSIGAVLSGEAAFEEIVRWIDQKAAWRETALIVTADHGHFLVIEDPQAIATASKKRNRFQKKRHFGAEEAVAE